MVEKKTQQRTYYFCISDKNPRFKEFLNQEEGMRGLKRCT